MIQILRLPTPAIHAMGTALIAGIALGWYGLALGPLEDVRDREQAEAVTLRQEQRALDEVRGRRETVAIERQRLRERLSDRIDLLSRSRINERLAALTSLATEYALTIDELTPKDGLSRGMLAEIPIDARLRGTYANVASFISALHDRTPDVDLRAFDITGEPARGSDQVRATFALAWYADPAG